MRKKCEMCGDNKVNHISGDERRGGPGENSPDAIHKLASERREADPHRQYAAAKRKAYEDCLQESKKRQEERKVVREAKIQ